MQLHAPVNTMSSVQYNEYGGNDGHNPKAAKNMMNIRRKLGFTSLVFPRATWVHKCFACHAFR